MSANQNTPLTVVEQKRQELAEGLIKNSDIVLSMPVDLQKSFKENFLELSTQDYLLKMIKPRELIRFAANITKAGLNINPVYKEVYIIPYDTKIGDVKIMLPQAIIPLNGAQEQAFQKDFFLRLYAVYNVEGDIFSEKDMTRKQQLTLQTANSKWVDDHFAGFDVELIDLKKDLPDQIKFVEMSYLTTVTKTIKDQSFKLQTWRHKAVRRAFGDFVIPRARRVEVFEKIEQLNDQELEKANKSLALSLLTPEIEKMVIQLGLKISKKDGVATVGGEGVYTYSKVLQDAGFTVAEGKWMMGYDENVIEGEVVNTAAPTRAPRALPKKSNPKSDLMKLLLANGITTEEAGKFVEQTFGDLSDLKKVEDIINPEKRDTLMNQIKAFLNPTLPPKEEKPTQSAIFEGIPPLDEDDEKNPFGE